jgi:hypothetical protein
MTNGVSNANACKEYQEGYEIGHRSGLESAPSIVFPIVIISGRQFTIAWVSISAPIISLTN